MEQQIVLLAMLTTFSLCGAIGNGLVVYVYTQKAKKDSATIFILALSCTDLLACLVTMPYTAVTEYLQHKLNYDLACKVYYFIITFNVPLSVFLMVVISVDRYLSICHALRHTVTPQRAKIVLVFPVLLALIFGSIIAATNGVYKTVPLCLGLPSESVILSFCLNDSGTNETTNIDPTMNWTDGHVDISQNVTSTSYTDMDIREYKPAMSTEDDETVNYATTPSEIIECMSDISEHLHTTREHKTTTYSKDESFDKTNPTFPVYGSITSNSKAPKVRKITATIYMDGYCVFSNTFLSNDAYLTIQRVYASCFLISLIVVLAFYFRIYVFVVRWRKVRSRQKMSTQTHSRDELAEVTKPKTEPNIVMNVKPSDVSLPDGIVNSKDHSQASRACIQNSVDLKTVESEVGNKKLFLIAAGSRSKYEIDRVNDNDKHRSESMLTANLRTAAMLFVVTVVFMLCFLPSWLMAMRIIPFQIVVFYAHFFYNVANPLIYAFMNQTFRKEMKRLFGIGVVNQRRL